VRRARKTVELRTMSGGESSDSSETIEISACAADRSAARPRCAALKGGSPVNGDAKADETRRRIQHHYQDRSNVSLSPDCPMPQKKAAALPSFPTKLFEMLDLVERDGLSHVISWQPHGRCFVIHRTTELEALLSRYLPGINKTRSFQRQASKHE
jgi:HSF-type DNA-binding